MLKASIVGATGYTGQELVRVLTQHPEVELVGLGTRSYVDKVYSEVYPHLRGIVDMVCSAPDDPKLIEEADVVFLALPHGLSVPFVEKIFKKGKKVVDLGADFRLKDPRVYTEWYKKIGPTEEMLQKVVYGLPEINRSLIKETRVVANPGCYPTTAILALYPLLKEKILDDKFIIIDSKSGASGTGRGLRVSSLHSEINEDFKAYGLPNHRHTPEIEQEISAIAETDIKISFTPHLLPLTRGMMSTIYTMPKTMDIDKIEEIYKAYYEKEQFVRVLPKGECPQTKWVRGTNFCDIGFSLDKRTGRLILVSVIDNLTKGASGQAVQNMNIMFGIDEDMGLPKLAMFP
ncbi:MAG: N-acetyl-gamma-glutamyl-phosphate reductase [Clostridia bacterium]|nr:N-acetyl-gamma-glutamyl-phosphate reductase [Clostridia bacterium]MDD4047918.1 N-acetyl-gamma-glutamyl-phosphate reductase [Clostridia bacterium]